MYTFKWDWCIKYRLTFSKNCKNMHVFKMFLYEIDKVQLLLLYFLKIVGDFLVG